MDDFAAKPEEVEMKVKDIMTVGPLTVSPDATITDAANMMLTQRLSALPVVDGDLNLLGIVSDGDLLHRPELETAPEIGWWRSCLSPATCARAYTKTRGRRVGEVMTETVTTVTPDTSLAEAVELMEAHRVEQLPVVQAGILSGMLSRRDILAALINRLSLVAGEPLSDELIASRIRATIAQSRWTHPGNIVIKVEGGTVQIGGTVSSDAERMALHVIAENTGGVTNIRDDLEVINPVAGFAYGIV
ncbi:CBS domain-containing protein [Acidiphilium sp.]|uniref:CBS domain-containing protein n=1 Tax=Acidiphilium sp. TaxID=527 RepID=UPI003D084AD6